MCRAEHGADPGRMGRAARRAPFRRLALSLLMLFGSAVAWADPQPSGLRLIGADGADALYAPQLRTDVAIKVSGMLARVRVQQRFSNPSEAWVEGVYVFPLPDDAAVDHLRMQIGERLVEGEIRERRQAQRAYDHARARGQAASLLKQQRANIFTTAVANIPPGESILVELEYQQALRWQSDAFSLRFPMVVAPRYIPGAPLLTAGAGFSAAGWSADTDQVPDAAQITPPVVIDSQVPADFNPVNLAVDLDAAMPLSRVESLYHPVATEQVAEGRYRVSLRAGRVPADRDFVLRWRPRLSDQPQAALFSEQWKDRHYALLMLMPPQATMVPEDMRRELILVVDTSGSMHGASIEQARAALLSALDRLGPDDCFNVIQFNSDTQALFRQAQSADAANLAKARRYVQRLQADGGTEMLPALRFALADAQPDGLLRQVVFITDGAVGNEQALFELIEGSLGDSRLFTVGIGSAPNALFMKRAARFGRGTFTFIGDTGEVRERVANLFGQLSNPVLTDVMVQWRGAEAPLLATQTPMAIPDLYAGEPIVVAVSAAEAPQQVQISGRIGNRSWQHRATLGAGADSPGVHVLWARRRIGEWLSRGVTGEAAEVIRDAVVELALVHHLVSAHTSLVAVDRTPLRPDDTTLRSAAVPSRLPAGWSAGAVFGVLPGTATPAPLFALLGVCSLLLGWLGRRRA